MKEIFGMILVLVFLVTDATACSWTDDQDSIQEELVDKHIQHMIQHQRKHVHHINVHQVHHKKVENVSKIIKHMIFHQK